MEFKLEEEEEISLKNNYTNKVIKKYISKIGRQSKQIMYSKKVQPLLKDFMSSFSWVT